MRPTASFLFLIAFTYAAFAQSVTGLRVVDTRGDAIPNAAVQCSDGKLLGNSDAAGTVAFNPSACRSEMLTISATGFQPVAIKLSDLKSEIRLSPADVTTTVTVTGIRTTLDEATSSVVAITRRDLDRFAGVTLDDRLRQVPGFTLFRRAGSRTANPTTQGVSLRGVGASGASRAIVLKDGVPLNDPFGGWVYWGRAVTAAVSEIEVLRGIAGDIYGSTAVGGVIALNSTQDTDTFNLDVSGGGQKSGLLSLFGAKGYKAMRGSFASEYLTTAGYIPVEATSRGAVDTPAGVERWTNEPSIETKFDVGRLFARGEFYRENRTNGTPLQTNDTRINSYFTGLDLTSRLGSFTLRGFGTSGIYHQSFSAVATDRDSESLNRLQTVPSRALGIRVQWIMDRRQATTYFAGAEARHVSGRTDETVFAAGRPTSRLSNGGTEGTIAVFGGTSVRLDRLTLNLSGRYDRWSNGNGRMAAQALPAGTETLFLIPRREESAFSPRAGIIIRATRHVSISASAGRSFRQPTLNELYRSFRVGNVVTQANASLSAERATGAEGAVRFRTLDDRFSLRAGQFCTWIDRPVSNVTLSATPSLITRQRQNSGSVRSCGFEADSDLALSKGVDISGGYIFLDPVSIASDGTRTVLPQTARSQFTIQASISRSFGVVAAQFRASTGQFDDDLNLFRLRGFATLDLFYSKALKKGFGLYIAVENVTNSRIEAGRTPVVTIGQPRTARIGMRFRSSGR